MPGPTQDRQASNLANEIIALAQSAQTIADRISAIMDQWNSLSIYTKLEAFPTCATLANGMLGAADASPVDGNVMDPREEPSSAVSMAIAAADVAGLATFLVQSIRGACLGDAVAANPEAPALLAKVM